MNDLKKGILSIFLLVSTVSQASWWGELKGGDRAAIIIGTGLLLNHSYQNSEIKHKENLKDIDTQIRREYEIENAIENAHYKYSNLETEIDKKFYEFNKEFEETKKYIEDINLEKRPKNNKVSKKKKEPKIIYSDEKSILLELENGSRIMVNKESFK